MEAYASSMYLKLYYLELAGGCKVLRTRYARGKKGELGKNRVIETRSVKLFICTQERARRETDDRTDEQIPSDRTEV